MENTTTTPKKGLIMSSVLVLCFMTFFFEILIGTFGLIGSSLLGFLSFILGDTSSTGMLSSAIQITAGIGGLYGTRLLWKLDKKGLLIFFGALLLSIVAKIILGYIFPTFLIIVYAVWALVIIMNVKKLS